ncbi:VWA domain-containing protein [Candidatus Acetothermia bacterium]|nr:VWA domain-containing protein [Candidatus Acetothermia bacterium]MBI3643307.1 VWA domain-containing protein [Candidatus Acetothermia bacterium]
MFKGTLAKPYKLLFCLLALAGLLAFFSNASVLAQRQPATSNPAPTTLPKGDIVFVMDESGSIFNDAMAVDANLNQIVQLLEGVLDYQVGIVGFGSYVGHMGTQYEGQPYINLKLTSDMKAFSKALKTLVTDGNFEYGFDAVKLATQDELGFRPGAGVCVVLITDEDADLSSEQPVSREDAIAALQKIHADFLGIVDPSYGTTMQDYGPLAGSLAQATGGKIFDIAKFRKDAGPVLRELISSCVSTVQNNNQNNNQNNGNTGTPSTQPQQPQPSYATSEELDQLKIAFTALSNQNTDFLARLSQIVSRIEALEAKGNGLPADLEARLTTYERNFQRIDITFQNFTANFNQYNLRLNDAEQNIASLRTTIAALQESNQNMAIRMQSLEDRIKALEGSDIGDRVKALEAVFVEFDSFKTDFGALLNWRDDAKQRLDALEKAFADANNQFNAIHATLTDLQNSDSGINSRVDDLTGRLKSLEDQTAQLSSGLGARIDALEKQLAGFAGYEARFQEIESKLNGIDLSVYDAKFQTFAGEIDALQKAVTENSQDIASFKDRASAWDLDLSNLKGAVGSLVDKVSALGGLVQQVADLQSAVQGLQTKLQDTQDSFSARFQTNEANLDALKKEIDGVNSDLQDLIKRLSDKPFALQSDLDSLASSLGSRIQSLLHRIQNLEAAGQGPDPETKSQLENLANLISQLQVSLAQQASKQNADYEEVKNLIAGHEEWLQKIEAWKSMDDERVAGLDQRLTTVEGSLNDLSAQLKDSQNKLTANQKTMGDLQHSLTDLKTKLDDLANRMDGQSNALDPAKLRSAQRLAEIAFLTAVAAIGISLLFFLSKS